MSAIRRSCWRRTSGRITRPRTDEAFRLASGLGSDGLLAVTVIDPRSLRLPGWSATGAGSDQERSRLETAASALGLAGHRDASPTRFLIWEGDPAESIVEAARSERADVIVVGSHGRGAIGRALDRQRVGPGRPERADAGPRRATRRPRRTAGSRRLPRVRGPTSAVAAAAKDAMSGNVASGVASGRWRRPRPRSVVAAVDPDSRETEGLRRNVVVEQALRDMEDPVTRKPDPLHGNLEVVRVRLVAPGRLRRDDPIEIGPQAPSRPSEQVVIAVRDHAEPETFVEPSRAAAESGKAGHSPTESPNAAASLSSTSMP